MIVIVVIFGECATKYYFDDHQAGLYEPILLNDECVLLGIDTIYNPLGGVVKVVHIRCKKIRGGDFGNK